MEKKVDLLLDMLLDTLRVFGAHMSESWWESWRDKVDRAKKKPMAHAILQFNLGHKSLKAIWDWYYNQATVEEAEDFLVEINKLVDNKILESEKE